MTFSVPSVAIASEIVPPTTIFSKAAMIGKQGGRTFRRYGPPRAVGDRVEAELAVGALDPLVPLARRHADAFHDELEVVDERLHVVVDGVLGRQHDVPVVGVDGPPRGKDRRAPGG